MATTTQIREYLNFGLTNVIDIDIMGFFDHIDHEKMMFFVMKRIADPYILKLIREWLKAGVVNWRGSRIQAWGRHRVALSHRSLQTYT